MISRSERAMCLSKYGSVYVWTYAGLCRDVHLCLNLDLNLNLSLGPYPVLDRGQFEKPIQKSFQKPFEASFDSSIGFE